MAQTVRHFIHSRSGLDLRWARWAAGPRSSGQGTVMWRFNGVYDRGGAKEILPLVRARAREKASNSRNLPRRIGTRVVPAPCLESSRCTILIAFAQKAFLIETKYVAPDGERDISCSANVQLSHAVQVASLDQEDIAVFQ